MADILVDKNSKSFDISDRLEGYSRVIIRTGQTDSNGDDVAYISGNATGRTLEIDNPWGNQTIADKILAKIQGWAYQPMEAGSVQLPPAYELGDSVVVNNVFSGIYNADVRFSSVFAGDIKAPIDKEIDHEYQFEDSKERKYTRKINEAVARLNFFADSIEAKVDKVNENSTFGWRLTENGWTVFNQNGNLFSVNAGGASVTGEIRANTGTIGGFTIGSRGISSNSQSYGGQEQTGVYVGTDGIQLGTKFRVDSQGNLYAASGTFDGNVYAKNIQYGSSGGEYYGYLPGGAITQYSVDTDRFNEGIRYSLGYADFSWDVFNNRDTAEYINCKWTVASRGFSAPTYYVEIDEETSGTVNKHTHYVTVSGNTVTIGEPDFLGGKHSFNMTGSATVQSVVVNGSATYQTSYNRYVVPVKVTLSNGTTYTSNLYVGASAAYNAGHSKGYQDAKDDCVVGYYYTSSWGSNNYYVIFANIGGDRAADASVYVDNNGHINS